MSENTHSLSSLTDEGLQALLMRAIRITLIVGVAVSACALEGLRLARCRNDGRGRCHLRRQHS